jgi:flagellar biosynthesis/type III secretory pathway protein FliH
MVAGAQHVPSPRQYGVLFAEDFDEPPPRPRDDPADEPQIIPPVPAPDIDEVRRESFALGEAQGEAAAQARIDEAALARDEHSRRLLERVADGLHAAAAESGRVAEQGAEALAQLLLGTLGTLLPALCARHGPAEVAALARAVLPSLAHVPNAVIRVAPGAVERLEGELARLDPDLRARLTVAASDAMPDGDVRITWQDGSASRDTARLWQAIGEVLAPIGLLDIMAPCEVDQ